MRTRIAGSTRVGGKEPTRVHVHVHRSQTKCHRKTDKNKTTSTIAKSTSLPHPSAIVSSVPDIQSRSHILTLACACPSHDYLLPDNNVILVRILDAGSALSLNRPVNLLAILANHLGPIIRLQR